MESTNQEYELKVQNNKFRNGTVIGVALVAIFLIIILCLYPSFVGYTSQRDILMFVTMLSLFFIPAIYISFTVGLAGALKRWEPVEWRFLNEKIEYKYLLGKWIECRVVDIKSIKLKEVWIQYSSDNIIWTNVRQYEIEMLMATNGVKDEIVYIGYERARDFGVKVEDLYVRLQGMYANRIKLIAEKASTEVLVVNTVIGMNSVSLLSRWSAVLYFIGYSAIFAVLVIASAADNSGFRVFASIFAMLFFLVGILVFFNVFHVMEPINVVISETGLTFRYLFHSKKIFASSIKDIKLVDKPKKVFIPDKKGHPYSVKIVNYRNLEVQLNDGSTVKIGERNINSWGTTIDSLSQILTNWWKNFKKS